MAWGFWGYIDYVLNVITPDSFDFDQEPQSIINLIFQAALVTFGLMLFRERKWSLVLAAIPSLVYLLQFGFTYLNLIGAGVFILFILGARFNAIQELGERTKINSRLILRRSLPLVVIGYFILISFAAYQSPVLETIKNTERLPSVSEVFIRNVVESTIGSRVGDLGQKEQIVNQVAAETIGEINTFLRPYFKYAPPALAFGLFLVLWGISWIFVWLSVFMGMGIFWILKKTGFIMIKERDVKAEALIV